MQMFPIGLTNTWSAQVDSNHILKALTLANKEGDTEAADQLRSMLTESYRSEVKSPTADMTRSQRVRANLGAGMMDLALGAKQLFGQADQQDAQLKRERDQELAQSTTGGRALQIAGLAAPAIPLAFVPGANTVTGAALSGGAIGAFSPTENESLVAGKLANIGTGAVVGGAVQRYLPGAIEAVKGYARKGINALANKGLMPNTASRMTAQADELFTEAVGNPQNALRNIGAVRDVPGVRPTTATMMGDTNSLMVERQLRSGAGEAANELADRAVQSNAARLKYLESELKKDPEKLWEAATEFAKKSKGSMKVKVAGIDPHGSVIREIGRLRNQYDSPRATSMLQELQDRVRVALAKQGDDQLESLHQFRMYELDDKLSGLASTDKKLAGRLKSDLQSIKNVMDKRINEGLRGNSKWTQFLEGYSSRARSATEAEAGQELLTKVNNLTPNSVGDPALTQGRRLIRTAADQTDRFGNPLHSPLGLDALNAVDESLSRELSPLAPNIRPPGSPTAANMASPTNKVMDALQPVIRGQPIKGEMGPLDMLAKPLQPISDFFNRRGQAAAGAQARRLLELYLEPQEAVKALRSAIQNGSVNPQQARLIHDAIISLSSQAGSRGGISASNYATQ